MNPQTYPRTRLCIPLQGTSCTWSTRPSTRYRRAAKSRPRTQSDPHTPPPACPCTCQARSLHTEPRPRQSQGGMFQDSAPRIRSATCRGRSLCTRPLRPGSSTRSPRCRTPRNTLRKAHTFQGTCPHSPATIHPSCKSWDTRRIPPQSAPRNPSCKCPYRSSGTTRTPPCSPSRTRPCTCLEGMPQGCCKSHILGSTSPEKWHE
jgi:hypothetical protein